MDTTLSHSLVGLETEELLSVEGARGRSVVVFQGKVWITQEGDSKDHIIGKGESFTIDRPGLALIEALETSSLVLLVEPAQSADAIGYEAAWPQTEPHNVHWGLTGTRTSNAPLPEAA